MKREKTKLVLQPGSAEKIIEVIDLYESLGWSLLSFEHRYPFEDVVLEFFRVRELDDTKPAIEARTA